MFIIAWIDVSSSHRSVFPNMFSPARPIKQPPEPHIYTLRQCRWNKLNKMSCSPTQAWSSDKWWNGGGRQGRRNRGEQCWSHLHVYSSSVGWGQVLCARVRWTCPIINPVVSPTMVSDCSTCKHTHNQTHIHMSQLCLFAEQAGWGAVGCLWA